MDNTQKNIIDSLRLLGYSINEDFLYDFSIQNITTAAEYKKFCKSSGTIAIPTYTAVKANFSAIIAGEAIRQKHASRIAEYPAIGEQLDAIYKRDVLGDSTQWDVVAAAITAVKAKYP